MINALVQFDNYPKFGNQLEEWIIGGRRRSIAQGGRRRNSNDSVSGLGIKKVGLVLIPEKRPSIVLGPWELIVGGPGVY